jgi:hypothetical protein
MHESPLRAWEVFYLIVGTTAGALIGLQFVVMALLAEQEAARRQKDSISAFGSPNIVHFCAALLGTSILGAPWPELRHAGVAISGCGVLGITYASVVLRRARTQRHYTPVVEDWIWHNILPILCYSAMLVAGTTLGSHSTGSLFVIGGALLMLVFIGIHNAWDTLLYITLEFSKRQDDPEPPASSKGGIPGPDPVVPALGKPPTLGSPPSEEP